MKIKDKVGEIIMSFKYRVKKIISKIMHINTRVPKNCELRIFSKVKESYLEGANIIDENTKIYKTYIGYGSVIGPNANIDNTVVGKYCSIGPNVKIIRGMHPTSVFVSTSNLFYSKKKPRGFTYVNRDKFEEYKYADEVNKKSVIIGNDVWIGNNAMIMEGVTIGDGAIVAAGAIVTKNVEPYSIVAGVPAKVIRYRFDKEEISFLLNLKWWDKGEEWIKQYANEFDSIDRFIKKLQEV